MKCCLNVVTIILNVDYNLCSHIFRILNIHHFSSEKPGSYGTHENVGFNLA